MSYRDPLVSANEVPNISSLKPEDSVTAIKRTGKPSGMSFHSNILSFQQAIAQR
ncbi:hypothetical protein N9103_02335 [Akkermansiaceae bacterium]|nr:hypothetical protein [Akkermansiaceae bacterium]